MTAAIIVVLVVSGALLIGAAWGVVGRLPDRLEGFLVALAGGALLVSAVSELIQPSAEDSSVALAMAGVAAGAVMFTAIDRWIERVWGQDSGGGLLAAVTLDGVPENFALGVALIGATVPQVAALAGAIFLSNLPEAAGGARDMAKDGRSKGQVLGIWGGTALILSAAAIVGNVALSGASPHALAFIRCFAAGAVVASLATEVFPKAFGEERELAGIACALGVVLAFVLGELGG